MVLLTFEQRLNAFGLLNLSFVVSWVISEIVLAVLLLRVMKQTEKQFAAQI